MTLNKLSSKLTQTQSLGFTYKKILRGTKDKDKRKASRRVRLTKGTRDSRRGKTWMISTETWRKPKEVESLKPFQVSQSVPASLVRSPISKGPTDGPLGSLNVFLRYAGFSHTPRGGRQGCVICTPSYTLTSGPPGCWTPFISTCLHPHRLIKFPLIFLPECTKNNQRYSFLFFSALCMFWL